MFCFWRELCLQVVLWSSSSELQSDCIQIFSSRSFVFIEGTFLVFMKGAMSPGYICFPGKKDVENRRDINRP
jgi:hypothetical protein